MSVMALVAGCTSAGPKPATDAWTLTSNDQLVVKTNALLKQAYSLKIYVVDRGDSVSFIAAKFHTTIQSILALNPDLNPRRVKVGSIVLVGESVEQ